MLKILIIGYGFAGRSLHHHCISKMRDMGWSNVINPGVVAIDNAQPRAKIEYENVLFQTALQPISKEDSAYCVLHVCSPPSSHFENIKTALNCGYRQIIVEKPAVSTREQLLQLKALERFYGAKILVVANWVSSAAVTKAKELLDRLNKIPYWYNSLRDERLYTDPAEMLSDPAFVDKVLADAATVASTAAAPGRASSASDRAQEQRSD